MKLDKERGEMTVVWKEDPGSHEVVLYYTNKDYGSGWTMLFIILGGMYLVSSLSWIFIDCTKTLADEAGQQEGEPEQEQGVEE